MRVHTVVSACLVCAASAAAASIGTVAASGHFSVGGTTVWGNSTLFDGARIETSDASSELRLDNGVRVQLGADSRARVWADHLVLEKGVGQMGIQNAGRAGAFWISAGGYAVHAAEAGSRVRVGLGSEIEIAALAGGARVNAANGTLVASIVPGASAKIALQSAQAPTVQHTGCLLLKEGRFIQQDEDTQQVYEINGPSDLRANVGNRVLTTGRVSSAKPVIQIAMAVIDVSTVSPRSQGGCLSVASALDAQANPASAATGPAAPAGQQAPAAPASGGSGTGLSTGAKVGIIAAVAGGGIAGGVLALSGGKKSTSQ